MYSQMYPVWQEVARGKEKGNQAYEGSEGEGKGSFLSPVPRSPCASCILLISLLPSPFLVPAMQVIPDAAVIHFILLVDEH